MLQQDSLNPVTQIKKTLENFMISIGILCGVILILYFFTYGALVDAVGSSLIWFEVITSIMVLFVLLFLKRVCFFLTRLKLGWGQYSAAVKKIQFADLALADDDLLAKLQKQ